MATRPITDGPRPPRRAPTPTPETQFFWDGVKAGKLLLQRCQACAQVYFPPQPFCPGCTSRSVEIFEASGKASLHSYVIDHRPRPEFGADPYAIAVVTLAEGPRMLTNIVETPQTPEALALDMPLEVTFLPVEGGALPQFRPAQKE